MSVRSLLSSQIDVTQQLTRLLKQDLTPEIELLPIYTTIKSTATSEGGIINTLTQSTSKISKTTSLFSTSKGDPMDHSTPLQSTSECENSPSTPTKKRRKHFL